MKQKTKHLSKATMSILLALVLVVSTLAVGIVSTSAAYLNGKPNTEANAADVAGDNAVGAKDSEAVGANAGEPVGGSWSAVAKKNGASINFSYDSDFEFTVSSGMLDDAIIIVFFLIMRISIQKSLFI